MTADEFRELDEFEQLKVMSLDAQFLASRKEPNVSISLFQLDRFYIEDHRFEKENERMIVAFTNTKYLAPYLEEIDISALGF